MYTVIGKQWTMTVNQSNKPKTPHYAFSARIVEPGDNEDSENREQFVDVSSSLGIFDEARRSAEAKNCDWEVSLFETDSPLVGTTPNSRNKELLALQDARGRARYVAQWSSLRDNEYPKALKDVLTILESQ